MNEQEELLLCLRIRKNEEKINLLRFLEGEEKDIIVNHLKKENSTLKQFILPGEIVRRIKRLSS